MGARKPSHAQQPQPPPFKDVAEFRQAARNVEVFMTLMRAYYDRIRFERRQQKQGIVLTSTVEPCWEKKFSPLATKLSDRKTIKLINLLYARARDGSGKAAKLFHRFSREIPTTPPQAA